jgi:glycosyltransferase involved in cell wall biosynthesis
MNVAIFTDNDFEKVNGVTTSLRAAIRYAPEGIHPRVYTASDLAEDRDDYFATAAPGMRMPFYGDMRMYWPSFRMLLRRVREDRIDLLHFTTPGPVGLAALFVAWRTGLRMVGSFHTDLAAYIERLSGSPRLGALMREYLRWPYGRCERVFVPSESTRRLLIDGRIDPAKIHLWKRGVDTTLFARAKRSATLRGRWRVCDRRPAVIYVGRLSKEKGLGLLPAIASAMHRRGVEHRLVLVGDGPIRRDLQAQLPDAVFTGTLPPVDVAVALASADLFVFPSDTDSAGNVVLEAQACGLPTIVSDQGGPKEYIRQHVTGIVCPAGDSEAFGHAAARLLRDQARRRTMGEEACRHAATLRWEAALAPLYRAYTEVGTRANGAERRSTGSSAPATGAVA